MRNIILLCDTSHQRRIYRGGGSLGIKTPFELYRIENIYKCI